MDLNCLTQKSQEAIHDAQTKALRHGHSEIDVEHLLLALLEQADGLVPRLLERIDVNVDSLRTDAEHALEARPRVTATGATGEARVSRALSVLLADAGKEAERLKDEYVSVEHLVLAMIKSGSSTAPGRLLSAASAPTGFWRYSRRYAVLSA